MIGVMMMMMTTIIIDDDYDNNNNYHGHNKIDRIDECIISISEA